MYNEEDNILPLTREIGLAVKMTGLSVEIILVDDASSDRTWTKISEARRLDSRVRGLRHLKNAGQSAALWTGLQNARGELIATLDGDLQNDPADIPAMLEQIGQYDFVCGFRAKRKDSWIRKISSKLARKVRCAALGSDFRDTGCAMRVFRKSSLHGLFPFNGLHRFLPILVCAAGARTIEIPVNHRPRVAGVSKYGVWNRLWRGIYDLIAIHWYLKRRVGDVPISELPPEEQPRPGSRLAPAELVHS